MEHLRGIARASGRSIAWLTGEETVSAAPPREARENLIQKLSFRASAGEGGPLALNEEAELVPFPRDVLDRTRVCSDHARLLTAVGESMKPTIAEDELLLVDVHQREVIEGAIYVFTIGDEVKIKRLRRRGGKLFMRSDNRDLYPDEEEVPMIEPVRIIGRVRWVGKSL